MFRSVAATLSAPVVLAGCASMPAVPVGPPNLAPIVSTPGPRAGLYADCIAQAAASGAYGHAFDQIHVIVFTCEGQPARLFFDALAAYSAKIGSEVSIDDRVIRSTTKIERDLFASDYCERRGAVYRCAITLRTGEFVIE